MPGGADPGSFAGRPSPFPALFRQSQASADHSRSIHDHIVEGALASIGQIRYGPHTDPDCSPPGGKTIVVDFYDK